MIARWIVVFFVCVGFFCRSGFEVDADALHPVRYPTEEEFFRANTHERTSNVKEMEEKISKLRKRRKFQAWNISNPLVAEKVKTKRPNILFILADDLGYGDLSVEPFTTQHDEKAWPCTEGGILTPNLERMAAEGAIMTNFHAAAPVCSPSRAAIMTGQYSWRMNAMNAFEVSKEDLSQLNGFLPQVPSVAEYLREEGGYFTAHSGKWHIGGMREENRRQRANGDDCSVPGPNQHGFEEYISALDGPESPRYSFLNRQPHGLHSIGHRHRIKNDVPMPILEQDGFVLSDYEAADAIAFMTEARDKHPGQPWFIQTWFNAPHGPWEILKPGEAVYNAKHGKRHEDWQNTKCRGPRGNLDPLYNNRWYYKTMVSAMDRSIGALLQAVRDLGLEEDTLIVFTSDNGPEWDAGKGGDFREGKRSLLEGGVRVPIVFKWKGVIPAGSVSTVFGAHTDLLPTFLAAAKVSLPQSVRFDGFNLLPVLHKAVPVPADKKALHDHRHAVGEANAGEKEFKRDFFTDPLLQTRQATSNLTEDIPGLLAHNRVHLWHKACDPFGGDVRRQAGGWYEYVKVLASNDGCIDRVFDMRHDPTEQVNLVESSRHRCSLSFNSVTMQALMGALSKHWAAAHCQQVMSSKHSEDFLHGESDDKCQARYHAHLAKKVGVVLSKLVPFFHFGKQGWANYMDTDFKHATCAVPMASQAKKMRWAERSSCANHKFGCTEPEYTSEVVLHAHAPTAAASTPTAVLL